MNESGEIYLEIIKKFPEGLTSSTEISASGMAKTIAELWVQMPSTARSLEQDLIKLLNTMGQK